nr:carotenoid biosynthesis protein [Candidatus Sigynarchaeum springense]
MGLVMELLVCGGIAGLLVHCLKTRGKEYAARIFGIGYVMGLVMENSGVIQGSYTEWGYVLYFPGSLVPVVTQLGWILVSYVTMSMAEVIFKAWPSLNKHLVVAAIITSLIATCWDVVLDPFQVYFGNWVWTAGAWGPRGFGWLGIPIINWLAWFFCIFGWALCTYWIDKKEAWSPKKRVGMQAVAVFLTALILVAGVELSFVVLEGTWVPIWNPPVIPPGHPWYP